MTSCSVIIPTRDRPELLLRAVKSAFAAVPDDGEVIVVDDASRVPVEESLSQFSNRSLRILRNSSPLGGGGSPSRNRGAAAAQGRVIFFLDDDDEFMPGYCRELLDAGASDQADFGFCARNFVRDHVDGKPVFTKEDRGLPAGLVSSEQPFARRTFPFSAGFWITRTGFEAAGPMAETLSTNSDTEYCCRMYSRGLKGWYSPEPGVVINDHRTSAREQLGHVTKRAKAADRAAAFRYIAEEHKAYLSEDSGAALFVHQRWMKHAVRADDIASAKSAVRVSQLVPRLRLNARLAGLRLLEQLRTRKLG